MAEVELKLDLDTDAVDALLSSDLFRAAPSASPRRDVYFDTPDHDLRKAGFSLRIRRSGDSFTQTVKATQVGSSDIYARGEWEMSVEGPQPVIDHSTPLQQVLGDDGARLTEQFEVQADRNVWTIKQDDSEIEAALDRGIVIAENRQTAICELDLELKDGKAGALFTLAKRVGTVASCRIGVVSKSERGYQLMESLKTAHKAEPVELDRAMTAAASFQRIASACFRHYRLNEVILLKRRQTEALHQARVAIRRLRSALVIYKPILTDDAAPRLNDELRWLASVLGDARDIDVLVMKADDGELREALVPSREKAYDEVMKALLSQRATSLFLDFNEWLRCGPYLHHNDTAEQPELLVADFASKALDRMRKKLKKHGHALDEIDDEHRHQARKDAKKFRYAAEFFTSVFRGKKSSRRHRRFVVAMEALQDHLGALNDLVTAPSVLEKLGLENHPHAEGLRPNDSKSDLIEHAQAALDEVTDLKRFWR